MNEVNESKTSEDQRGNTDQMTVDAAQACEGSAQVSSDALANEDGQVSEADQSGDFAQALDAADQPDDDAAQEKDGQSESWNKDLGKRGEDAACSFLERKGFTILERNWKCVGGEADIIACVDSEYGSELHFIEVKTRMSTSSGFPEEAVTAAKRKRYEIICEIYLQQNYCEEARVTFDVISILVTSSNRAFLKMHCNVLSSDCC